MSDIARLLPRVLCLGVVGFLAATSAGAAEKRDTAQRRAWQYRAGGATLTFLNVRDKEWVIDRPNGRMSVYDELDRTDRYIELRDRRTHRLYRLQDGRGDWRGEGDTGWKGWARGTWVSIPMPPDAGKIVPPDNRVRLAYFVPNDREPALDYAKKIRVIAAIVADLYRTDLRAKGYETEGVRFVTDGVPVVEVVRGAQAASYYNNAPAYDAGEQWRRLIPEIREGLGGIDRRVIVAFAETYDDGPAEHLWPGVIARAEYHSPDGGLAIYSAHLLRDEFCALSVEEQREIFFDRTPVPGRRAWGDRTDSPRGEFAEDGCGAVAHLLGLALGLPRDRRDDATDIMGNGFRNLRRNFRPADPEDPRVGFSAENARLLMSSRYLAQDLDTSDDIPPVVVLELTLGEENSPRVTVKASDNTGLRAIVFSDMTAGTVIGGRQLSGRSQEFHERLPDSVVLSGAIKLRAIVTDDGGNQTRANQTLRVR